MLIFHVFVLLRVQLHLVVVSLVRVPIQAQNLLLVFGGSLEEGGDGRIYSYNIGGNEWSVLQTQGTGPQPRL